MIFDYFYTSFEYNSPSLDTISLNQPIKISANRLESVFIKLYMSLLTASTIRTVVHGFYHVTNWLA